MSHSGTRQPKQSAPRARSAPMGTARRSVLHNHCCVWRCKDDHVSDEEVLEGGVANAGAVVRVGDHVLRPSNPHSESIHRYLGALRRVGFDGAPVPVGIDTDGRERLEYIAGDVATPPYPAWA